MYNLKSVLVHDEAKLSAHLASKCFHDDCPSESSGYHTFRFSFDRICKSGRNLCWSVASNILRISQDKTFTCTLFMPYDIFQAIKTEVSFSG